MNRDQRPIGQLLDDSVAANGDSLALRLDETQWTYRELQRLVDRTVAYLAGNGVTKGSRVGLSAGNSAEFVAVMFATARLGATLIMISTAWRERELEHALAITAPTHLVTDGSGATDLAALPTEAAVLDIRGIHDVAHDAAAHAASEVTIDLDDLALMVFSSGTTGLPKAVCHTHRTMFHGTIHWVEALGLTSADRLQIATPPFHILGALNLLAVVAAGASVRLHRRFDLDAVLTAIEGDGVTIEMAVAPIALAMASRPDLERFDLSTLRYIMWGATPVTASVAETITRRSGVHVLPAYGASELPVIAVNPVDRPDEWRLDSVGLPPAGVTMRVVDLDTGDVVGPGGVGELQARSPSLMIGYLPDESQPIVDGWYATGDVGTVDADGWVTITDRVKEMIKVNGFQVAPAEVEGILLGHSAVVDCAVFGVPDAKTGEAIVAAVVLSGSSPGGAAVAEELRQLVATSLASYKRIAEVVVVEQIPRLPSGKVLRRELKADHLSTERPTERWENPYGFTTMNTLRVHDLRAEHLREAFGIGVRSPRLSWITDTDVPSWRQAAYEVEIDGVSLGRVESDASVLVDWPGEALESRQRASVRVRVWDADGGESPWSEPLTIEASLCEPEDWAAMWITPPTIDPLDRQAPSPFMRRSFSVRDRLIERARLYVTSAGVHRIHLNGHVVGDHVLAPGWSSYANRLRYDTHDVTSLIADGDNALGAVVADGWWRGFLKWDMLRNVYGERLGLLAQLEITYEDGTTDVVTTDDQWRTTTGPFLAADLYQGETYDARLELDGWDRPHFDDGSWEPVEPFEPTVGALVAPPGPPVRRIEERPVREVLTSPSGATVLDFGQNLVGRIRFTVNGEAGTVVTLRHAEVLEHGEPAYRPLRNAEATDHYTLRGDGPETWEPTFTFHGFRYVEVRGWPGELDPADFVAVVLHSDMERTGTFSCDNELLNQLHSNVVWGMRGNFLDVPTDCPQRDERLGWTGDLQVFAPTAAYLYDVSGMIGNWLDDLRAEQRDDGTVPIYIPTVPPEWLMRTAGWSDAVTVVPEALHLAYGDTGVLDTTFDAMRAWVDYVTADAGPGRLWEAGIQLGDWLDPNAPPDAPMLGRTDSKLVATAYFARSAQILSDAAGVLGRLDLQATYSELAAEIRQAFRLEYVTPKGRVMSDTATAYSLALEFGMIEEPDEYERVAARLSSCVAEWRYQITTGFLGTPAVLPALTNSGDSRSAYRLVTQTRRPSWLYSVLMGATTMWERWDSILPDGSVNPGEMTSFNHYAFGCVGEWMHTVVGGLKPAEPGYRRLNVAPVPGHGVNAATATLRTPYGPAACDWSLDGHRMVLAVTVPPNTSATIVRPGLPDSVDVGSGHHEWTYDVPAAIVDAWRDETWNPGP